jgi:AcrR family transcriptional regulator
MPTPAAGWLPDRMGSPTAGRRARTPSALVPRELLQAAEAVLVRDGISGLTVRAVAAEAGVAPMGVYNRLGGKEGLLTALLSRGFDRLRAAIEVNGPVNGAVNGEPTGAARLRSCCLRYRDFALANPSLYAILFDAAVSSRRGRAEVREDAAGCLGALIRAVELAAAEGSPGAPDARAALDAREAAQQVWSALHGAVTLELRGLAPTADPAAAYRRFLDTMLRGLLRPMPDSAPVNSAPVNSALVSG